MVAAVLQKGVRLMIIERELRTFCTKFLVRAVLRLEDTLDSGLPWALDALVCAVVVVLASGISLSLGGLALLRD